VHTVRQRVKRAFVLCALGCWRLGDGVSGWELLVPPGTSHGGGWGLCVVWTCCGRTSGSLTSASCMFAWRLSLTVPGPSSTACQALSLLPAMQAYSFGQCVGFHAPERLPALLLLALIVSHQGPCMGQVRDRFLSTSASGQVVPIADCCRTNLAQLPTRAPSVVRCGEGWSMWQRGSVARVLVFIIHATD
jgi:hypothetical protein